MTFQQKKNVIGDRYLLAQKIQKNTTKKNLDLLSP